MFGTDVSEQKRQNSMVRFPSFGFERLAGLTVTIVAINGVAWTICVLLLSIQSQQERNKRFYKLDGRLARCLLLYSTTATNTYVRHLSMNVLHPER